MTGGGMMGAFLALMVTGLPVAMAMAGAALIYVMLSGTIPDFVIIHRMYGGVDSFPLLAVPFFIWAGNLMNSAGITNRIYNFALALVGWLKGGLGHVNVVGSMLFAGMSGTAIADAGAGNDRNQGDEGPRLLDRVRRRRHRGLGHGRPDHPAVAALRDLRHDGRGLDRPAVPRRRDSRHPHGRDDDAHGRVLRAHPQLRARRAIFRIQAFQGESGSGDGRLRPGRHLGYSGNSALPAAGRRSSCSACCSRWTRSSISPR